MCDRVFFFVLEERYWVLRRMLKGSGAGYFTSTTGVNSVSYKTRRSCPPEEGRHTAGGGVPKQPHSPGRSLTELSPRRSLFVVSMDTSPEQATAITSWVQFLPYLLYQNASPSTLHKGGITLSSSPARTGACAAGAAPTGCWSPRSTPPPWWRA